MALPRRMHLGDEELVLAARGGDRDALAELLSRHHPLLLLLCRRATGDAEIALDAAQEASLVAMLNLDRLRDPESFGPWLAGIGLNVSRRLLLRRPSHPGPETSFRPEDRWARAALSLGRSPEEAVEEREVSRQVRHAIDGLPRGQRDAALMHYIAGFTQPEVAALLGIATGAVKARLHKARGSLRRRLLELWKEEREMEAERTQFVEMGVADVRGSMAGEGGRDRFVVVLREASGGRGLPIWVGPPEDRALATILAGEELPRPDQYHFADRVLAAAGGRLAGVRIAKLADITYYAEAVVEGPAGRTTVDARPSDAMALALMQGASILVEESLLDAVQEDRSGSWRRFKEAEPDYPQGASEIAARARSEWEQAIEEYRQKE